MDDGRRDTQRFSSLMPDDPDDLVGFRALASALRAEARWSDLCRLYERRGYREVASKPMVKDGWQGPGESWVAEDLPLPRCPS